jgi:hypothetical protein
MRRFADARQADPLHAGQDDSRSRQGRPDDKAKDMPPLSPLKSILTEARVSNPFRMNTYAKRPGGGPRCVARRKLSRSATNSPLKFLRFSDLRTLCTARKTNPRLFCSLRTLSAKTEVPSAFWDFQLSSVNILRVSRLARRTRSANPSPYAVPPERPESPESNSPPLTPSQCRHENRPESSN